MRCLMAMPRLVFPLLACLCFFLAGRSSPAHGEASSSSGLHPVVLVPGFSCSKLDARLTGKYRPPPATPWCGARKGKGWFRLWENHTAVQEDPRLVPCFADQLRLVFDHAAGDYRNAPGVLTRVVAFGTTRGFGSGDPAKKNNCMEKLVTTLEGVGYREGENLFGAPYDFRHAAAPPGQPSRGFSSFLSRLRRLVEHASRKNGGKPVVLVAHSLGGHFAIEFLNRSPLPWRRRMVKHFLMLSNGASGGAGVLQFFASAAAGPPQPGDVLSYANTSRSFAALLTGLPSPRVLGRAPLVVTRDRNYSAFDVPEFLTAVGFSAREVAARYLRWALPVTVGLRAPLVPMTSVMGVGVPTVRRVTYWDGDFRKMPQVVNGDGDGAINLEAVLALRTVIGKDPEQGYFKSVLLPNTSHNGIISDDLALKRLVSEILAAANQTAS